MNLKKTSVVCGKLTVLGLLAGCAAPPAAPLTQQELTHATYVHHAAHMCVQKGYVSDLSSMAELIQAWETYINMGASADQIAATSREVSTQPQYNLRNLSVQDCRQIQLAAMQQSQTNANDQREEDVARARNARRAGSNSSTTYCNNIAGVVLCNTF